MSLKSTFGLDWFELGVHVSITVLAMMALDSIAPGGHAEDVLMAGTMAASILVLAFRRSRGLERQGRVESGDDDRLAQMEDRLQELEAVQQRVMELEERVDFTERLLARERDLKLAAGRND